MVLGQFNGMDSEVARLKITDYIQEKGLGKRRSVPIMGLACFPAALFGAPIPIIYCDDCSVVPVPEEDLPVLLPEDVAFQPTGESPLLKAEEFLKTTCPSVEPLPAGDRYTRYLCLLHLVFPALLQP